MTGLDARLMNLPVILTLIGAGAFGYARLLWELNLRPAGVLWMTAVAPGAIFLVVIWAIRAAQGTPSLVWPVLLIDWVVFSASAVLSVLAVRRWRK